MTDIVREMVQRIVNSEARRNASGKIIVYKLDPRDGGGKFEVAGVNEKYHRTKAYELKVLVESGQHIEAEREALNYILSYTKIAGSISSNIGISYNMRDCAWNRGPTGAIKILQRALNVAADGNFGPISKAALEDASADFAALLKKMRIAREAYERLRGRDESSPFWNGLRKRWDRVLKEGIAYNDGTIEPISVV